jgi:3-hydroxyacyl-[acyl-carrier-protein] dehydratase
MFKDTLFTIIQMSVDGSHGEFEIRLNAEHPIYTGHFPNDPITPGVCIVQITTDLFEHVQGKPCALTEAKNIKFLNLVRPKEHAIIRYSMDWEPADANHYKVKSMVTDGDTVFAKMSVTIALQA